MRIPKDTDTFKYFNANPYNRKTDDCVFRAISLALFQPWKQTVMEMANLSIQTGYSINSSRTIDDYLKSKGWIKMRQPRKPNNTKYTGKEFVRSFKIDCVANIGGHHIVCIKNGKVVDTWDSTDGCIGNYWVPQV